MEFKSSKLASEALPNFSSDDNKVMRAKVFLFLSLSSMSAFSMSVQLSFQQSLRMTNDDVGPGTHNFGLLPRRDTLLPVTRLQQPPKENSETKFVVQECSACDRVPHQLLDRWTHGRASMRACVKTVLRAT